MKPVCANCGIPIFWQPTQIDGQYYCCLGCAHGGPCTCDYSALPDPRGQRSLVSVTDRWALLIVQQPGGGLHVEYDRERRFRLTKRD